MTLGLPEFGSGGASEGGRGFWRFLQFAGLGVVVWVAVVAAAEWRTNSSADQSLERTRAEAGQVGSSAEEARRSLQKNSDLLVATTSVESSPEQVLKDLSPVLPEGVSLTGLKIEYLPDATARLDLSVVARSPDAYDRFLSALSKSPLFGDIKPGSESRPGLVRAIVSAIHRPRGAAK